MHLSGAATPEFSFSRLFSGFLLVPVLLLCAPRGQATPVPSTTTTLSVTFGGSVTQGTTLILQATVLAGATAVTTGSVTFYDGVTVLSSTQLVNSVASTYTLGTANLKLRLGPGSHVIKAVYGGVNSYLGSTSSTQTITVTASSAAVTSTEITSSGSAGDYTLSGKVTAYSSSAPTGNVSFLDQSNSNHSLGSTALDAATRTSGWQSMLNSATADASYGVVMGDLNGDGIPDLVTSNYSGTTLSVLLGIGDGSFQAHVDYEVGSYSFGLALGDVNGDGYPDIAVAFHTNSGVGVLLGNGDGTFQAMVTSTTGEVSEYIALADLNRDGDLDIVTLNSYGGAASVLLGNGNGTFQAEQSFGVGSYSYGLTVAHFNNDGKVDVAVSNYSGSTVSVLLGNGDGTLQTAVTYPVGDNPTNLVAVDLDADGNQDLVVCSLDSSGVSVLLGNGDGTFKAKVDYAVPSPWDAAVADVNGDGIPDVVATSLAGAVDLLQGVGDGTLLPAVSTSTSASNYMLALGDLNGDGVIDVAVANLGASNVVVSLGSISATATLPAVSIPGGGSHNVIASYAGDAHSAVSVSSLISLTGSQVSTSLALSVSPDPASPGQSVSLTATVTPSSSGGYTPTGTVIFSDGGAAIGSPAAVSNGHAILSKSDLASGDHDITAAYSGDENFTASTASADILTVSAPDYSITATPTALTIRRGQTGTATLTLTPVGAYSGPVAFTCSGLPQFATCTFSPASVQVDGSNTALTVQFRLNSAGPFVSPASSDFGRGSILSLLTPFLALSLLSITGREQVLSSSKRSRWVSKRWLHLLILAAFFLGVAGCGSISRSAPAGPKTPLGTSTVTATAAAVWRRRDALGHHYHHHHKLAQIGTSFRGSVGRKLWLPSHSAPVCYATRMPRAFLIDTDVASDDAVALIMALRAPEVRVVAITTVAGNVEVQQATRNALYTAELCGASVPVFAGAEKPLRRAHESATWFHGLDGLGDHGYPPPRQTAGKLHAVDAMIDAIEANPGIVVVTLGPLTNLAQAVTRKPALAAQVGRCVVMGGAPCCEGNVTPAAEYNIWVDPEAARIVMLSGLPVELIGWQTCRGDAVLIQADITKILGFNNDLARFAIECNSRAREAFKEQTGEDGISLPDPVAMSIALDPTIGTQWGEHYVEVEAGSELTRGMTVVDRLNVADDERNRVVWADAMRQGKTKVCWTIDTGRWKEALFAALR